VDILVTYTGTEDNGLYLQERATELLPVDRSHFFKGGYSIHRYLGPNAAGLSYHINP